MTWSPPFAIRDVHIKTALNDHIDQDSTSIHRRRLFPLVLFLAMGGAILALDAVLPLQGLWFYDAILKTRFYAWLTLPTHLLFPEKATDLVHPLARTFPLNTILTSWKETGILFTSFILLFLAYLLALFYLPSHLTHRTLMLSTLLFGLLYTVIPIVTSQDIFSYIGYARMGVIYGLNPLTTLPTAIRHDPIYSYIYWIHQPSAYGPTWIMITCSLQWITLMIGLKQVSIIVMLLRLFGLLMHLGSTQLIWSISGELQRFRLSPGPRIQRQRLLATLAFAWNPLLLLEACVNAHNDTTMLFLVLLALWSLASCKQATLRRSLLAAFLLALAACLKITLMVLAPGLLLFLWTRGTRRWLGLVTAAGVYTGTIILLYLPFWQQGRVLSVFQINPATLHEFNTPYEFVARLYSALTGIALPPSTFPTSYPVEKVVHVISDILFLVTYSAICVRALRPSHAVNTVSALIRWMTLAWFLYCALGAPWFWPWYMITFFGLYALIEAQAADRPQATGLLDLPMAVRLLILGMLGLYCFMAIGPTKSYIPQLYLFQCAYLRGLWEWLPVLLAIRLRFSLPLARRRSIERQKSRSHLSATE